MPPPTNCSLLHSLCKKTRRYQKRIGPIRNLHKRPSRSTLQIGQERNLCMKLPQQPNKYQRYNLSKLKKMKLTRKYQRRKLSLRCLMGESRILPRPNLKEI